MARSKIKLSGSEKDQIEQLIKECSNNNQICFHLKRNEPLVSYLKDLTGLDREPMVLFYHYVEKIYDIPKCICGSEKKYRCYGYRPTCGSKKCIKKVRESSKKEYCQRNYGVDFVTQLDTMKEKSKSTMLEKYGVDNITKDPESIKKRSQSNLEKWGVTDPIMLPEFRNEDKMRVIHNNTIQSGLPLGYKYLGHEENEMMSEYYIIECPIGHITSISKSNLSVRRGKMREICTICNEYIGSMVEQEVFDFISTIYSGKIDRSNRKLIKPFEIDIILEDIKVCIEFNGDYWHSTKIVTDQYYHYTKYQRCLDVGFKLLQIKEDDWYKRNDFVKNSIMDVIFDNPVSIQEDIHILDLSWYDDRFKKSGEWVLISGNEPKLIKVGKYLQWDSGQEIYVRT
jgi:hypothetical protein